MQSRKPRKEYTPLDKTRMLAEAAAEGYSVTARKYDVHVSRLFVWRKEQREGNPKYKCHLSLVESQHPFQVALEKLQARITQLDNLDATNELAIAQLHNELKLGKLPANVVAQGLKAAMETKARLETLRLEYERAVRETSGTVEVKDITPAVVPSATQTKELGKVAEQLLALMDNGGRNESN